MISPPTRWLFAALTCYRLASLFAYDDGPLFILARLRSLAEKRKDREQAAGILRGPWASLYDLVSCPYCQGMWLAVGCLILVLKPSRLGDWLLGWGAITGIQSYLQSRSIV